MLNRIELNREDDTLKMKIAQMKIQRHQDE